MKILKMNKNNTVNCPKNGRFINPWECELCCKYFNDNFIDEYNSIFIIVAIECNYEKVNK